MTVTDQPLPIPRIDARGVSKGFGVGGRTMAVLDRVDIAVGPHEFVSVLGPSGCGKSTLFNIIAGLDEPSEGLVRIDGSPQRLGRSGYMPQRDLLMPWKKVADNVSLGAW
jgi:ABC-type nitrate/sulfonate/bicarbonate transport system ATPase subunit